MKPLTNVIYVYLFTCFMSSTVDAHVFELEDVARVAVGQVKNINAQNSWQLYSPENKLGVEMYYDSEKIQSPYDGIKIVTTKMVYNDLSFLEKLKKARKLHHQVMGDDSEKLNYTDIAYTVQTYQISCSKKEFLKMEVIADFDKNHNLLNLVPSVRRQFSTIRENSSIENLYKIVCN